MYYFRKHRRRQLQLSALHKMPEWYVHWMCLRIKFCANIVPSIRLHAVNNISFVSASQSNSVTLIVKTFDMEKGGSASNADLYIRTRQWHCFTLSRSWVGVGEMEFRCWSCRFMSFDTRLICLLTTQFPPLVFHFFSMIPGDTSHQ